MAVNLAATFTLISCIRGSLCIIIKISGILFDRLLVPETLNCEGEVKNPQDYYVVGLRKYGTTVGHVLHVISCICMLFFNIKAWWLA